MLITILVLVLVGLVIVLDARRRDAENKLQNLSIRLEQLRAGENTQQNVEVAQEILSKLRKHMVVPEAPEPTVAAIIDVETLRKRNAFYAVAKNGDYLIVTTNRAILYDPDTDRVLDVVPVQVQPKAPAGAGG